MKRYLYIFGYEGHIDCEVNKRLSTDYESSTGLFIEAETPDLALTWGHRISSAFVSWLYQQEGKPDPQWKNADWGNWIEEDIKEIDQFQDSPTVRVGQFPDFNALLPNKPAN